MDDQDVMGRIEELVAEEHRLLEKGDGGELERGRPRPPQGGPGGPRPVLGPAAPAPGPAGVWLPPWRTQASARDEGTVEGYLN